jgi:regulator of protease activity HflC (stomatin/prohibitin superfamily)
VNESLVASAIKTSSKTLSPVDVTNRSIIEPKAQECVQESLDQKYGKDTIKVNKVVINNAQFDEEYDQKIAQKQQSQMAYETQAIENKKNIEKAEADAKVKQTTAEAEAKANQTLENSLSKSVLTSKFLDKWNGELPKAMGGDKGMIFDVSSLMGSDSAKKDTATE